MLKLGHDTRRDGSNFSLFFENNNNEVGGPEILHFFFKGYLLLGFIILGISLNLFNTFY